MTRVREFPLPDLGEGLTEGEILKWLVAEGDMIKLNQPIVEVETAKAAVEIPAKWAGKVTRIFHPEGATVEVGTPIIAIDTDPGAGDLPDCARAVGRLAGGGRDAPAEGAIEPGMIGGPAPGGRTAVLVGYGPRTTTAARRPRKVTHDRATAVGGDDRRPPRWRRPPRKWKQRLLRPERCWPSRRCASWPGTWAWTSSASPAPGPPGRSPATTCRPRPPRHRDNGDTRG